MHSSDPNPQITYFGTLRSPFVSLAQVKLTASKSVYLLTTANTSQLMTCCPQLRRGQGNVTTSNFGKIVAISRKWYEIVTRLQQETIRKSYAASRMVILPMPLSSNPQMTYFGKLGPLLYLWHG